MEEFSNVVPFKRKDAVDETPAQKETWEKLLSSLEPIETIIFATPSLSDEAQDGYESFFRDIGYSCREEEEQLMSLPESERPEDMIQHLTEDFFDFLYTLPRLVALDVIRGDVSAQTYDDVIEEMKRLADELLPEQSNPIKEEIENMERRVDVHPGQ